MRVIEVSEFGGPEVLVAGEAPDPAAGPGQVVVGVSVLDPEEAHRRGVSVRGMEQLAGFAAGRTGRAERVIREAAAGRIRPLIGQTYPLERAADAHAAIEARSFVGKTLLLT